MVLFSYIASSPFVLQNVMGLSPLMYAVTFGVVMFATAILAAICFWTTSRERKA